jgi:hypothetical protein
MSLIKDTWRHMVQRRLWPFALLLVAAIVAVPMVLAEDPQPLPPPQPVTAGAPGDAADAATEKPVVALATADDNRRHVLGARKDPFRPAVTPTPTPSARSSQSSTTGTTTGNHTGGASSGSGSESGSGSGSSSGGTSTGTSGGGTLTPSTGGAAPTAPARRKSWPGDSLTVRFGSGDGSEPKTVLEADQPLPETTDGDAAPLLVYVGLTKGGKEALFLVDASVNVDGDGRCDSDSASLCETLHLRAGDTEFLDVVGEDGAVVGQYQLDLLAIHPSKQTVAKAAKAKAAKRRQAKGAKAATAALASAAGAASTRGSAHLGAGVGALLGSL